VEKRSINIDTQRLTVKEGYVGVREIVFSYERIRTIFGNYIDLLTTMKPITQVVLSDKSSFIYSGILRGHAKSPRQPRTIERITNFWSFDNEAYGVLA